MWNELVWATDGTRGVTIAEMGIDACESDRRPGNATDDVPDGAADMARDVRDARDGGRGGTVLLSECR